MSKCELFSHAYLAPPHPQLCIP